MSGTNPADWHLGCGLYHPAYGVKIYNDLEPIRKSGTSTLCLRPFDARWKLSDVLLNTDQPRMSKTGLYYFIHDRKVKYIGQTTNQSGFRNRVIQHLQSAGCRFIKRHVRQQFESYEIGVLIMGLGVCPFDPEDRATLSRSERAEIQYFEPDFNAVHISSATMRQRWLQEAA